MIICKISFAQSTGSINELIANINVQFDALPKVKSFNGYMKFQMEYDKTTNNIKLFSNLYDKVSNEKKTEYYVTVFNVNDIDPNSIVVAPYSSSSIMLQLVTRDKQNIVSNSYFMDDMEVNKSKVDRASISYFNVDDNQTKLDQLKRSFEEFFKAAQAETSVRN